MTNRTTKWLAIVAGSLWLLLASGTHAPAQSGGTSKGPSEQINVEAAVDFPYDI